MSLVKLWKSLRGRSKESSDPEQLGAEKSTAAVASVKGSARAEITRKTPAKRRIFGAGPHAGLCKQLKGIQIETVLEITVDDGTRALAVWETLRKNGCLAVRYAAIDEFELGDTEYGLRDFYRFLREHGIQPRLIPESIDNGLRRVANTLGSQDLVIITSADDQWQNPVTLHLLSRITHPQTMILHQQNDAWVRFHPESVAMRRVA